MKAILVCCGVLLGVVGGQAGGVGRWTGGLSLVWIGSVEAVCEGALTSWFYFTASSWMAQ